jgi:hypothetical protein
MCLEVSPVLAIWRAVAVSAEIGQQGATENPGRDEEPEPVNRRVDVGDAAAVLDEPRGFAGFAADAGGCDSHLAMVRESQRGGGPHRFGAGTFGDQVAFGVEHPRRGPVGMDEVIEFGTTKSGAEQGGEDPAFRCQGHRRETPAHRPR